MNKRHFSKTETVLKVMHRNPELNGKYLFNRNYGVARRDIETFFVSAVRGNGDPIVHLHDTAERSSSYVKANAARIDGYVVEVVKVPLEIERLIDEYASEEDEDTAKKLEAELNNYFLTP